MTDPVLADSPADDLPVVPPVDALRPLTALLRALDPAGPPEARLVCGTPLAGVRRLVALAGSFNPPHAAHVALVAEGLRAAHAEAAAYLLSVRTVDKEQPTGMLLEDRLWLLCRLCRWGGVEDERRSMNDERRTANGERRGTPRQTPFVVRRSSAGEQATTSAQAVVVVNRGLYVDQAAALRALCPALEDLVFLVGYDKIVQILDARYYENRAAALDQLFSLARFLVAPRDAFTGRNLAALLAAPENRPYAGGIAPLPIDPALAPVSSTTIRGAAARGEVGGDPAVPPPVRAFLEQSGCYATDGRYDARAARLAALRLGVGDQGSGGGGRGAGTRFLLRP